MSLLMKCVVLTALSLYACGTHAQSWQLAWSDEFNGELIVGYFSKIYGVAIIGLGVGGSNGKEREE